MRQIRRRFRGLGDTAYIDPATGARVSQATAIPNRTVVFNQFGYPNLPFKIYCRYCDTRSEWYDPGSCRTECGNGANMETGTLGPAPGPAPVIAAPTPAPIVTAPAPVPAPVAPIIVSPSAADIASQQYAATYGNPLQTGYCAYCDPTSPSYNPTLCLSQCGGSMTPGSTTSSITTFLSSIPAWGWGVAGLGAVLLLRSSGGRR